MRLPSPSNQARLMAWAGRPSSAALAWALWPKPVTVEVAEVRKGRCGHGRRGGQDAHQGRLYGIRAHHWEARAPGTGGRGPGQEGRNDRGSHRADGAAVPRRARHARARGPDRGRQGGRGAGRSGGQSGGGGARVRRERAQARARPDRTKAISERAMERARIDVDTRRAALARAKASLEVRKRELESAQARLIGPEEQWKGEVRRDAASTCALPSAAGF